MRAHRLCLDSSFSYPLFFQATTVSYFPSKFLLPASTKETSQSLSVTGFLKSPLSQFKFKPVSCSDSDIGSLDLDVEGVDDDDDIYYENDNAVLEEKPESLSGDGVYIEIKKIGRNSRRIQSKIGIDASLEAVWEILTNYEKLVDHIPGLAVSELVERKDNFVRLYQIGQQNLAFGIKFNAKGLLDCYEKDLEIISSGRKREIEFRMIEGDFQLFEGTWSIEQINEGNCKDNSDSPLVQDFQTTLSYTVDVKPKIWLPVRVVEGRICNEIKSNLVSIRDAAQKLINKSLHTL